MGPTPDPVSIPSNSSPPSGSRLENRLHTALADRRVNKVNARREFFYAGPAQVRDLLQQIAGQHLLAYHDTPEALEWRASSTNGTRTVEPSATAARR
jgi:hypothetical protein